MIYLKKEVSSKIYNAPASAHKIDSFNVSLKAEVITANIESFYDEAALIAKATPLAQYSIVIGGKPEGDAEEWIYSQLALGGDEVERQFNHPGTYPISDRNLFQGGVVELLEEPEEE